MMKIKCLTDSSSDLGNDYRQTHQDILDIVLMPIIFQGHDYHDDFGVHFPTPDFYVELKKGTQVSTSQINTQTFYDQFKKNHEQGFSTIHIGITEKLSGTINNARIAVEMLHEDGIPVKVAIIDSRTSSLPLAVLVDEVLTRIRQGLDFDSIVSQVEAIVLNVHHGFAVERLDYLRKSGRISSAKAFGGSILNIKPILMVNYEGTIGIAETVRGQKRLHKHFVNLVDQYYDLPGKPLYIGYGNSDTEALHLKELLSQQVAKEDIHLRRISATLTSHLGADVLAVSFLGSRQRVDVDV